MDLDPPACSTLGTCIPPLRNVLEATESVIVPAYEPVQDTEPPTLTLVGLSSDSMLFATTDGVLVLRETMLQGDAFVEPGFVCLDGEEDVSDRVNAFGRKSVDTSEPTADGAFHRVIYSCDDASGNQAQEVQRWIAVTPK